MIEQNHECYVSLEVAKLLKEAGFDWECSHWYSLDGSQWITDRETNNLSPENKKRFIHCPSLAVTQRWLREVNNFDIYVCPTNGLYFVHIRKYLEPVETKCEYSEYPNQFVCHTYEEALEAGIQKCLTILLEEKK